MKCEKGHMLLYAVTDRAWTGRQSLYEQVESALRGGVTCLQLREKALDEAAFFKEAAEIGSLCRQYGVPFLVNDNLPVAIASGADGVHIGQSDLGVREARALLGSGKILGVSAQTVEQARRAVQEGADYLGVGAVFPTATKTDASPVPLPTLQAICQAVEVPVVAIGGIGRGNLLSLSGSGVQGVALVSAIFGARDITSACRELRALAEQMAGNTPSERN